MKKLLVYPLTVLHLIVFISTMVGFDPLLRIAKLLGGYKLHKIVVDRMAGSFIFSTRMLGTSYKFINDYDIPTDRPLIIVSNHQSMHDISPFVLNFKKNHPKFISKKALGSWKFFGIAHNLNHGGSVLIDRKKPEQAVQKIEDFGKYIEKYKRTAVLFPEGTRSRNGKPKKYKVAGFKSLVENAPSALIVPVTINNSWQLESRLFKPESIGLKFSMEVHKPLERTDFESLELMLASIEKTINSKII